MQDGPRFQDRAQAGRELAVRLAHYKGQDCVVYGLPRGGAVTAREVAAFLDAPLDLLITRKLSHPIASEYAIGAISDEGETIINDAEAKLAGRDYIETEMGRRLKEAQERKARYL